MKILITESTQVNHGDDLGGQHAESGNVIDVSKDNAKKLTEANRALYVNKTDDPFKDGRFTATKEMLQAAANLDKAKQQEDPPAA